MMPRSALIRPPSILKSGGRSRSSVSRKKWRKAIPHAGPSFFAAVQRGRMVAFDFAIKGSFESGPGVAGTFVPSDAIHYWITSLGGDFGESLAAGGRAWGKKSGPDGWGEAPGKTDFTEKIITSLFPPTGYVGRVPRSGCMFGQGLGGRPGVRFLPI